VSEKPKPQVREIVERDGHQIAIYESGAEYDVTAGHLVRGPDHARITPETALAMRQRGIDIAMKAKVRAFAAEAGIDVSTATDEELLTGYGSAQEAIHRKAYQLFMEAKTPRAAEGLYLPLQRLPGESERGAPVGNTFNVVQFPPELLKAITDLQARLKPSQPSQVTLDIIEGRLEPFDQE
jgi:hypothetical protein